MSLPTNPINRKESYLNAIATGNTVDMPAKPITREEAYLDAIAKNGGGGGGGGTTNYNALDNKPQIAGTTLQGDKSLADLGIASASDVATALGNKVDKVEGKGLSTNDYSDTEKGKVADNTSAIEAIVNVNGAKNWALLEPESESKDGITFTCTDGKSLTLSGTASDNTGKSYNLETPITGNVIVTLEQTANKVTLSYNDGTDWHPLPADGKVNGTIAQVGFNIVSGTVINERVYLMIRDARITDPTYAPYAMTNAELTERVNSIGGNTYMGIFQNVNIYDRAYGIVIVPNYRRNLHNVVVDNFRTIDGASVTVGVNTNLCYDGVVGLQSTDLTLLGKIVNGTVAISNK